MATLLMCFDAPMQSWGTQSNFGHRDTGLEPSKSGVLGLVGAALGRPRDSDISDLAALRMGVRVDREGIVKRDFHTAGKDGYARVGGGIERGSLIVSERFYLSDALFLIGLQGADALLVAIDSALRTPVFPLFLGRKAFVPARPIWITDGLVPTDLETSLKAAPWLGNQGEEPDQMRLVIDDPQGSVVRHDQPISFAERRFVSRSVSISFMSRRHMT